MGLPVTGKKYGKSLTMNRAIAYFRKLGKVSKDTATWAHSGAAEKETIRRCFQSSNVTDIEILKIAILEGFRDSKLCEVNSSKYKEKKKLMRQLTKSVTENETHIISDNNETTSSSNSSNIHSNPLSADSKQMDDIAQFLVETHPISSTTSTFLPISTLQKKRKASELQPELHSSSKSNKISSHTKNIVSSDSEIKDSIIAKNNAKIAAKNFKASLVSAKIRTEEANRLKALVNNKDVFDLFSEEKKNILLEKLYSLH
jgi:hypothetical protein